MPFQRTHALPELRHSHALRWGLRACVVALTLEGHEHFHLRPLNDGGGYCEVLRKSQYDKVRDQTVNSPPAPEALAFGYRHPGERAPPTAE